MERTNICGRLTFVRIRVGTFRRIWFRPILSQIVRPIIPDRTREAQGLRSPVVYDLRDGTDLIKV